MIKKFHKAAIAAAQNALEDIQNAQKEYNHSEAFHREKLERGVITRLGYEESMEVAKERYEESRRQALARIEGVRQKFDSMMDEVAKPNGAAIDADTMKLLDSGLKLSGKEWQDLATRFSDNATMTRLLKERYNANPQEKQLPDGFFSMNPTEPEAAVVFGQMPESRRKAFDSFCDELYRSTDRGSFGREYPTIGDYWNARARHSLSQMTPYNGETFEEGDIADSFPVTEQAPRPVVF